MLGGTFQYGRDTHRTSAGNISGLMINAYALAAETAETRGIGLHEAKRSYLLGLDIFISVIIIGVFSLGQPVRAKMWLSAVPIVLTVILSYLAFRLGYAWVSCIGIALGFPLHLLLEVYLHAGHEMEA